MTAVTVPFSGLTVEQTHDMIGKPVTVSVNDAERGPITLTGVLEFIKTESGLCYVQFSGTVATQTEMTFSETQTASFTYIQKETRR